MCKISLSVAAALGVELDVVRLTLLASVLLYMSLLPFMVFTASFLPLLLKTVGIVISRVGTVVINCNL